ncbi:hypothetical protein TWF128_004724, partial [Orbilia oligospora]
MHIRSFNDLKQKITLVYDTSCLLIGSESKGLKISGRGSPNPETVLQAGVLIFAGLTVYKYPSQFLVGSDGKPVERTPLSKKIQKLRFSDSSDYIVSATANKLLAFNQFNKLLWVAVSTTVYGFIVQFVGLRAIHASVIMAQLGATILMAIVRAGLRAQRAGGDKNLVRWPSSYIKGHELDFAAMEYEDIVSLCVSQWYEGGLSGTPALVEGKGAMALKARARFARLTNGQDHRSWNNLQVREIASQVQRAIEGIMGILSVRFTESAKAHAQRHYWTIGVFIHSFATI